VSFDAKFNADFDSEVKNKVSFRIRVINILTLTRIQTKERAALTNQRGRLVN